MSSIYELRSEATVLSKFDLSAASPVTRTSLCRFSRPKNERCDFCHSHSVNVSFGLDVVEGEPNVPANHVLVKEPRCVVLPHVGSATIETRMGMAGLAARNVLAGVEGAEMGAELDLSRYK